MKMTLLAKLKKLLRGDRRVEMLEREVVDLHRLVMSMGGQAEHKNLTKMYEHLRGLHLHEDRITKIEKWIEDTRGVLNDRAEQEFLGGRGSRIGSAVANVVQDEEHVTGLRREDFVDDPITMAQKALTRRNKNK